MQIAVLEIHEINVAATVGAVRWGTFFLGGSKLGNRWGSAQETTPTQNQKTRQKFDTPCGGLLLMNGYGTHETLLGKRC